MTDIMKRKFIALEISGKNYMTWVLDAEIHLDAMGLGDAIKDKNKERYDNLKLVTLPQARYDWAHMRLQDFKSVSEYNSAMFRITSKLKLCGDTITDYDMLEKTFTTFHASNMVLQQQY
ncbi:uncharacterized protein [Nicotiana tomentosiformis]|uniref:uncharacterized protein n=1 Tax=Nicotiana tomentosiformis TaxID=4098 RepID=UPI00388C7D32